MNQLAILIPCYNEGLSIHRVVSDCHKHLPQARVYVYDNNSTDNTQEEAQRAGAIVRTESRQGKGNVMSTMFREVEADYYLILDGDDTYPLEAGVEMLSLAQNRKLDMVIGDRLSSTYFQENKRRFHNTGNRLVRFLVNRLFNSQINDIMTGMRLLSRHFVKNFPVVSKGFSIETEMTIHALDKNYSLASIPISYRDRGDGSASKLNTFSDGYGVLRTILILFSDYHPLLFYGLLFLLLEVVALVLVFPVLRDYAYTGLVPRFPTLIMAGIISLMGMLMLLTGILLEAINRRHKQLFFLLQNK